MPIWFNMNKFTFDVVKSDCAVCLSSGAQDRCWKAFFQRYWINPNLKLQLVPFKKKQFLLEVLKVFWNEHSFYLPFHVHLLFFDLSSSLQVKLFFFAAVQLWNCTSYLSVFTPNAGKYGPVITPYLDTFHTVDGILQFYIYVHVHIHVKTTFKKA